MLAISRALMSRRSSCFSTSRRWDCAQLVERIFDIIAEIAARAHRGDGRQTPSPRRALRPLLRDGAGPRHPHRTGKALLHYPHVKKAYTRRIRSR